METKKLTNLKLLHKAAGGEVAVVKEVIELYMKQLPSLRIGFRTHLENRRWSELGNTARIAKTSAMTVGLNDLAGRLKQLQVKIFQQVGFESYQSYIDEFDQVTALAEIELAEELYKLSSLN